MQIQQQLFEILTYPQHIATATSQNHYSMINSWQLRATHIMQVDYATSKQMPQSSKQRIIVKVARKCDNVYSFKEFISWTITNALLRLYYVIMSLDY